MYNSVALSTHSIMQPLPLFISRTFSSLTRISEQIADGGGDPCSRDGEVREGRVGGLQSTVTTVETGAPWRLWEPMEDTLEEILPFRGKRAGAFRHQLPCLCLRPAREGTVVIWLPEKTSGSWKLDPVLAGEAQRLQSICQRESIIYGWVNMIN